MRRREARDRIDQEAQSCGETLVRDAREKQRQKPKQTQGRRGALLVRITAETAEVVGDGVLVTRGNGGGIAAADLAGFVFALSAQLQFEFVNVVENLGVETLD